MNVNRRRFLQQAGAGSLGLAMPGLLRAAGPGEADLPQRAREALRKATIFFSTKVATEGGYLWRYSADLALREGENRADANTVWVQPPGTPAVGMALLEAYQATGEQVCLDAARRAGECLVRGQLRSGGWAYSIHFAPKQRWNYAYRTDPPAEKNKQQNTSILDDNATQAALLLLMRLDRAFSFRDPKIHEAAQFALAGLLAAQYPNGAWPQRFDGPLTPDARKRFPVVQASYPKAWSRTFPREDYQGYYTLNDNALADTIQVMFEAAKIYDDEKFRQAARRGGDFLLLAQMPEPQPAWAQQYDADMHPAWARKFEPPAVTGGESQQVMQTLMDIYRQTGDRRYLEPIPRAIGYLRHGLLADGRLARFYELRTNRPLYFTRDYVLTYSDDDVPTHYSFKVGSKLDGIERRYRELLSEKPQEPAAVAGKSSKSDKTLAARAEKVIAALDEQGRWIEPGTLRNHPQAEVRSIIDCRTFADHVRTLAEFIGRSAR